MLAPLARFQTPLRRFGRRAPFVHTEAVLTGPRLADDARLFLMTFVGGLVFMTVYLA